MAMQCNNGVIGSPRPVLLYKILHRERTGATELKWKPGVDKNTVHDQTVRCRAVAGAKNQTLMEGGVV